jgi:hypothetical protein
MQPERRWDPRASSGLRVDGSFHRKRGKMAGSRRPSVAVPTIQTNEKAETRCLTPPAASDQGDDLSLCVVIGLDVSGGRPQACMPGERLDISKAAADFTDLSGRAGDETSPAGMA